MGGGESGIYQMGGWWKLRDDHLRDRNNSAPALSELRTVSLERKFFLVFIAEQPVNSGLSGTKDNNFPH